MEPSSRALNKLLDGSDAAWAQFVHASAPIIWGQIRRCFGRYGAGLDPIDLEDVGQDVYVRLSRANFRLLRLYDPKRAQLSTYLGVVAHSASVDFLRKRHARHEDIEDPALHLAAPEPPKSTSTRALRSLLPKTLLSRRQNLILTRLFDEDKEIEEIANELGVAAQTIRSAKHKALSKIRKYFYDNPHLKEAA